MYEEDKELFRVTLIVNKKGIMQSHIKRNSFIIEQGQTISQLY